MSLLSERLGKGFIFTVELNPPRGPDLTEFRRRLGVLKSMGGRVSGVNIVDSPGARLLMSSLAASVVAVEEGLEPIYQIVCRDRNALAIQSDLIGAAALGVENVLAVTGDHPLAGGSDHKGVKTVYEFDSTTLLRLMSTLNRGLDVAGGGLNKPTKFFIGAAACPGSRPLEPEVLKMGRKMEAGAVFFQTQVVFERDVMESFLSKTDELVGDVRKKTLMGVIPLASPKTAEILSRLPGIIIAEERINALRKDANPVEHAVSKSLELVDAAREMGLAGVHFMPIGRMEVLERVFQSL